MKKAEAIAAFGNAARLAAALGISRPAVSLWGEDVPPLRAYQIRELLAARAKVSAGETPEERQEAA